MRCKHGYINPVCQRIETVHCECCLFLFWSRERLFQHVKRASKCKAWYLEFKSPLPHLEVKALDAIAAPVQAANSRAGLPAHHARYPCLRLAGPRRQHALA